MIIGLGNDVCDIRRIEASLEKFGTRFEQRCFTNGEQKKAQSRSKGGAKNVAGTYAKRFAAKEACAKALGTGLRNGTYWRDMEVVNLPSGAPTMRLTGNAAAHLKRLTPEGYSATIHLTLTDEYPYASAIVMIEATPIL